MVSSIAATPHTVTRSVPRATGAPPKRAPAQPVSASATNVAATVASIRHEDGAKITAKQFEERTAAYWKASRKPGPR